MLVELHHWRVAWVQVLVVVLEVVVMKLKVPWSTSVVASVISSALVAELVSVESVWELVVEHLRVVVERCSKLSA